MSVSWQTAEDLHWKIGKDAMAERAGVSLIPQPAADLTLSSRELDQSHQTMEEWVNSAEWLEWHENMVNEELLALYTASREREQGG